MNYKIIYRTISTTSITCGKKNFRKFIIPSRGSEIFKNRQENNPDPGIPLYSKYEDLLFKLFLKVKYK